MPEQQCPGATGKQPVEGNLGWRPSPLQGRVPGEGLSTHIQPKHPKPQTMAAARRSVAAAAKKSQSHHLCRCPQAAASCAVPSPLPLPKASPVLSAPACQDPAQSIDIMSSIAIYPVSLIANPVRHDHISGPVQSLLNWAAAPGLHFCISTNSPVSK